MTPTPTQPLPCAQRYRLFYEKLCPEPDGELMLYADHQRITEELVDALRTARSYVDLTEPSGRSADELASDYPEVAVIVRDLQKKIDDLLARAGRG